jgi:haloalkane dehalogenase
MHVPVPGGDIHAMEAGSGPLLLFLHGNPTSSELWRDVILNLASDYRCIAPDLIGMGQSSKPKIAYTFADHAQFLRAFLNALDLSQFILVAHDWGVALALDILVGHPESVRALAFMEGRVRPLPDWSAFDQGGREMFQQFRREPDGTRLVIENNMLIEMILQAGTMRSLTPAEMDTFRAPYIDPEARRPLLQWTREIPIGGEPALTAQRMERGYEALRASPIPKLAVVATPGAVIDKAETDLWRQEVPNLSLVDIGEGSHFLPLDRPREIAAALRLWIREHELGHA